MNKVVPIFSKAAIPYAFDPSCCINIHKECALKKSKQPNERDIFTEQVREALDHFNDPTWLGNHSPLAAPYFVESHAIRPFETGSASGRGQMLRRLLLEVAVSMAEQRDEQGPKGKNLRLKLETNYVDYQELYFNHLKEQLEAGNPDQRWLFSRYLAFPTASIANLMERFVVSRAALFRQINTAIKQLGTVLLTFAAPALRLETPPMLKPIVGREARITACLATLRAGQTVALSGLGGVGKTSLGAHLVARLENQPVFWLTLRPGLNDHLHSILFALSRFLQNNSNGSAFRRLIADQGRVNMPMIEGLIRDDLQHMQSSRPLLCFDELDLLQPTDIEAHAQILTFLESLRPLAPMLLIGQHLPIDAGHYEVLDGLDHASFTVLLDQANIKLTSEQLTQLHLHLKGNPRLLELFIILYQSDESLPKLMQAMARSPSLESLLNRVWQRLSSNERNITLELSVYRSFAPSDIWREEQQDLTRLIERRLVQDDGQGGVALLPAFRTVLYQLIPAESREALHQKAAFARSQRGEFTAAAYHYINAARPSEAVLLWDEHRVQEINQGRGEAALQIFKEISISQVSGKVRETLALLRGELQKRAGDYPAALRTLQLVSWQTPKLKIRAKGLEGDIYDLKDEFSSALAAYEEGLSATMAAFTGVRERRQRAVGENTSEEPTVHSAYNTFPPHLDLIYFHRRISRIYMRQRVLDRSWQEVLRARYEVEDFQGVIQEYKGNHTEARTHYENALALAQECGYTQGEAKTRNNLLRLLVFRGEFAEAFPYGEEAYRLFRFLGDRANQASVRVNQALGYNQAGQPEMAITLAEEALTMFDQLGEPWGKAVANQNLAEAHLALGNLPHAMQLVDRVLREEETNTIPDTLRTWGEIELKEAEEAAAKGNIVLAAKLFASARQHIQQSLDMAVENKDIFLEAYGWRALGKVYLAQRKANEAKNAFDKAIALFEQLGLPHEVAVTRAL